MEPLIPDTRVLAIASHVVYGHVGNKMASIVMQSLGCDVSALNTVQFSQSQIRALPWFLKWKGTKTSAAEIRDLYAGLKQNYLTGFDMMLSGYAPSAEAVEAIGTIARELRLQASTKPGSFFWVLDPVMGDEGKLYVNEDCVPIYKQLLRDADLILPNQFELELLSGLQITSTQTIYNAMESLHREYQIPHIVVTSIRDPVSPNLISVIGSTARSDLSPRIFKFSVPSIDCFFSGTGDMFAGLTLVRFRQAAIEDHLLDQRSWVSPDGVQAIALPLARAIAKVMGSMQTVLEKTKQARDEELKILDQPIGVLNEEKHDEAGMVLRAAKAAEVRVVRCLSDLRYPSKNFKVIGLEEDARSSSI